MRLQTPVFSASVLQVFNAVAIQSKAQNSIVRGKSLPFLTFPARVMAVSDAVSESLLEEEFVVVALAAERHFVRSLRTLNANPDVSPVKAVERRDTLRPTRAPDSGYDSERLVYCWKTKGSMSVRSLKLARKVQD